MASTTHPTSAPYEMESLGQGKDTSFARQPSKETTLYPPLAAEDPIPVDTSKLEQAKYAEGGYGWMIVLCTFTICLHFMGILYSWGVIQSSLLSDGLASSRLLSIVGGLEVFFFAGFALPASWLIAKYGVRNVGLVGVCTSGISLILSSFATKSLGGLIFLQGILFGLASGTLFMTSYPLPSQYFLRKRGLATGITSAGGGVGGAVWSIVIERLIRKVGLPWTYRIMGLSTLVFCLPAAWMLRPGYIAPSPGPSSTGIKERSILRQSMFIRILICTATLSYIFFIPPFFIPQYAVSIGLSASQGALYSALYNIASGIGRLGFGVVADYLTGNLQSWCIAYLCILLPNFFVWPYATTSGGVIGFAFWCGLGSGGYFSLQSSIVGQIVGSHKIHQGIGYMELVTCCGYFLGPVTAGILLDAFGGQDQGAKPYRPAMYLVGATTTVALMLVVWVRFSFKRKLWAKA